MRSTHRSSGRESASSRAITSPRALSYPVAAAAGMPIRGSGTTRAPQAAATAAVSSVEPLSTTTTSHGATVCRRSRARHSASATASSRAGMTTDTVGTPRTSLMGAAPRRPQPRRSRQPRGEVTHRVRVPHLDAAVEQRVPGPLPQLPEHRQHRAEPDDEQAALSLRGRAGPTTAPDLQRAQAHHRDQAGRDRVHDDVQPAHRHVPVELRGPGGEQDGAAVRDVEHRRGADRARHHRPAQDQQEEGRRDQAGPPGADDDAGERQHADDVARHQPGSLPATPPSSDGHSFVSFHETKARSRPRTVGRPHGASPARPPHRERPSEKVRGHEADRLVAAVAERRDGRRPAPAQRDGPPAPLDRGAAAVHQLHVTADEERTVRARLDRRRLRRAPVMPHAATTCRPTRRPAGAGPTSSSRYRQAAAPKRMSPTSSGSCSASRPARSRPAICSCTASASTCSSKYSVVPSSWPSRRNPSP